MESLRLHTCWCLTALWKVFFKQQYVACSFITRSSLLSENKYGTMLLKQMRKIASCCGHAEGESRQDSLPGAPAAKGPIISVKRLISCPTYCSRLHVNQHMAEHLLPELPETRTSKVCAYATPDSSYQKDTNFLWPVFL